MVVKQRSKKKATEKTTVAEDRVIGDISKIERYGWIIKNEPGQFEMIDKKNLHIDHGYQREMRPMHARRIAKAFSWMAFGVLLCARRGGKLWVFEGQHRLSACLRRSDIQKVPCLIWDSDGAKSEAAAFADANEWRLKVSAIDQHTAHLKAKDPIAVALQKLFDKNNVEVVASATKGGQIQCVKNARRMFIKSEAKFRVYFETLAKLSREENEPISVCVLSAISWISDNLDGGFPIISNKIESLGIVTMNRCALRANSIHGHGGASVWADQIIQECNKGRNSKQKFKVLRDGDVPRFGRW